MVKRNQPPDFHPIERIEMIQATSRKLAAGTPLYVIDAGKQDILRIEFLFPAGIRTANSPLLALMANSMLLEGTHKRKSEQIATELDYYGAFLENNVEADRASLVVFTLSKYLRPLLDLVADILENSVFPGKDLEILLDKKRQQFIVDNKKPKIQARRRFSEVIFGKDHPYGRQISIDDFDNITRENLVDYASRHYRMEECQIFMAGRIEESNISLMEETFKGVKHNVKAMTAEVVSPSPDQTKTHLVDLPDAMQSSIRIGKPLFNRRDNDYPKMLVLNTILGGYFGSRLMKNIREEKGYTYGIGSVIVSLDNSGYFTIVTEVGKEYTSHAIDEVFLEIKKLMTTPVETEELTLVRNYMMGELVREFDGPLALSESFRRIHDYGLDYSYYDTLIDTIKKITPEELLDTANKYLDPESLYQIVAGKMP